MFFRALVLSPAMSIDSQTYGQNTNSFKNWFLVKLAKHCLLGPPQLIYASHLGKSKSIKIMLM